MKDLSFFFRKSLMGSKMGRGIRNVCNDDNSTSTLNQKQPSITPSSQEVSSSTYMEADHVPPRKSVTLEEMILQLEIEEEIARKEKAGYYKYKEEMMNFPRRMSCVNNSDILRSARNALNQYPRFSLDGRDAMYRSSFRKSSPSPRVIDGLKLGRMLHLPNSVGGENVIWCKPGVVPKLMGLEAMPLPISSLYKTKNKSKMDTKQKLCNAIRNQNLKRREKSEAERRQQTRHVRKSDVCCGDIKRLGRGSSGGGSRCSSSNEYCVMNPIALEPVYGLGGPISWPNPYKYTSH
ncbi:uncharacterized protein LOC110727755 [Chenopodium quinoa]|uniref:uncharacterized protein LOC110727755 n=1 Tax=Chenopodium quinoa TaxID=63459 RepID=UPI000B77A37C|nr:uncharacterized protein LOC110727755 [Chenopodium quinoa]